MDLPRELKLMLAGRRRERVCVGESDAAVWRCTQSGQTAWYLKAASAGQELGLEREAACMRWMRDVELPAPAVLTYCRWSDAEFLLSEAAVGIPASDSRW